MCAKNKILLMGIKEDINVMTMLINSNYIKNLHM